MTSKFALIIANTEYQDASFAKLTAPGKDAEEFARVLRDPDFAAFDEVQVLINEGEGQMRRALARFFTNRQGDDLLLLYFSGHGIRNGQGQLFLATNDTEISILEATAIPAEFVTYAMNNSRSRRQLLILDCCNSGAFAYGSKSALALGRSMGIENAFEGSGFGRVVLTATDATQYAWEGDKVIGDTQKSVFTHFLIEGLRGEADRDGDGRIHVDELYDYAYEQVVRRTPKQTPGKWSYKQQGDIILRDNLKPRDVKPAPLPFELLELLSHPSSGVRKAGVQELISLLEGKHLGLARAAQEKLHEIFVNDDSLTLRKNAGETLIAHGIALEEPVEISKENLSAPKPAFVESLKKDVRKEKKIEKPPPLTMPFLGEGRVRERAPRVLSDWKSIASKSDFRLIGGIVVGLLIISLLIWGGSKLLQYLPITTPESTLAIQPTSALGIGSTMEGKDGMTLLYVPAGEFTMGNEHGNADEKPAHKITIDAFWIDRTEVTNKMYSLCVKADACEPPMDTKSYTRSPYYGNSEYDNYPVIYVDWSMANAYCKWAARRLPTEAEWEKAARGDNELIYPWGNDPPRHNLSNYNRSVGDTTEVGKYPDGKSVYGAVDMAGNVWEWVTDWYSVTSYASSRATPNPDGPDSGQSRVLRGGSWSSIVSNISSAHRNWRNPSNSADSLGFRCAMSATP